MKYLLKNLIYMIDIIYAFKDSFMRI